MVDEISDYWNRYHAAAHAMQSGVSFAIEIDDSASPKHLRVGINSAMVDSAALAKLLMDKGFITELEYAKSLAEGMEAERKRYEQFLSEKLNKKVSLA